jgi:hypothetical protein
MSFSYNYWWYLSVKENMSQLIDTLKRAAGAAPKPMGFGANRTTAAVPGIALIAVINPAVPENQVNHLGNADAVLIQSVKSRLTAKNIEKAVESLPNTPWGIFLEDNDGKKMGTLIEAGCDFVTFPAAGKISDTPTDEKVGRILQVEASIDDGLIRAVNDLPVDAALIGDTYETSDSLVWHQLMIFQHLANLISKPLLASVPVSINESELKALWEVGIDGVVIAIDDAAADCLPEIRKKIEKLPARSMRKRGKMEALLPRATGNETMPSVPDEDEEYE